MIVADFSMNNGRENRNNGNQEKGKEEKEALRKSVRSQKRGTPKASPKFLCGSWSEVGSRRYGAGAAVIDQSTGFSSLLP
jgi:hypothetical protein